MTILKNILIIVYVIICLALIIITTMQSKDDEGLSGTITGSGSSNFLDKNKGRTKIGKQKQSTIVLGISFAVLTVILSIVYVI